MSKEKGGKNNKVSLAELVRCNLLVCLPLPASSHGAGRSSGLTDFKPRWLFPDVLPMWEAQNLPVLWVPTLGHPWIASGLCSPLRPPGQSGHHQLRGPTDTHMHGHCGCTGDCSVPVLLTSRLGSPVGKLQRTDWANTKQEQHSTLHGEDAEETRSQVAWFLWCSGNGRL